MSETTSAPVETGSVRYSSTVTAVGELVDDFRAQGMLVLFATGAPEELHEMCALHEPTVTEGSGGGQVQVGDIVEIDDQHLPVTAVGERANENLTALGHVSLKANGADEAPLPGDICVIAVPLPPVAVGSTLIIRPRPNGSAGASPGD